LNKQLQQYQAIFIILLKIKKGATVYLDLAKAFDTIDHKIVLKNVNTLGINGTAQKLLSSYLKNRKQHVRINNELSEETSIICGVPDTVRNGDQYNVQAPMTK